MDNRFAYDAVIEVVTKHIIVEEGKTPHEELNFTLAHPVRVVPKLTLVMHDPSAFQDRSWSAGVHRLWPDARVVAEGQTELAIGFALREER